MLASSYRSGSGGSRAQIALATDKRRDPRRPFVDGLADLTTGSIAGFNKKVALMSGNREKDPFLTEIEAIKNQHDTGTTLALRLKKIFQSKTASQSK